MEEQNSKSPKHLYKCAIECVHLYSHVHIIYNNFNINVILS